MGGGADSRIPSILKEESLDVIVRTYDFDPEVAADRVEAIMTQQYTISEAKMEECMGKTYDVLVEGYDPYTDSYYGRTYMDSPDIDNNIIFTCGYEIENGEIVPVEIFDKDEYSLIGEAV